MKVFINFWYGFSVLEPSLIPVDSNSFSPSIRLELTVTLGLVFNRSAGIVLLPTPFLVNSTKSFGSVFKG